MAKYITINPTSQKVTGFIEAANAVLAARKLATMPELAGQRLAVEVVVGDDPETCADPCPTRPTVMCERPLGHPIDENGHEGKLIQAAGVWRWF